MERGFDSPTEFTFGLSQDHFVFSLPFCLPLSGLADTRRCHLCDSIWDPPDLCDRRDTVASQQSRPHRSASAGPSPAPCPRRSLQYRAQDFGMLPPKAPDPHVYFQGKLCRSKRKVCFLCKQDLAALSHCSTLLFQRAVKLPARFLIPSDLGGPYLTYDWCKIPLFEACRDSGFNRLYVNVRGPDERARRVPWKELAVGQ